MQAVFNRDWAYAVDCRTQVAFVAGVVQETGVDDECLRIAEAEGYLVAADDNLGEVGSAYEPIGAGKETKGNAGKSEKK